MARDHKLPNIERTHRTLVMDTLRELLPVNSHIVEIGTTKDWTASSQDGHITLQLLSLAVEKQASFVTVDTDPYIAHVANQLMKPYNRCNSVCMDGLEYLTRSSLKIDLLVLGPADSRDDYKEYALKCWENAKMKDSSLLMVDEVWPIDNLGQAEYLLEPAIQASYKYIVTGYTCVMKRDKLKPRRI